MHTRREILLVLVLFIIESACNSTTITTFVQVPVNHWQRVESEITRNVDDVQKLLFVAQHDADEVEKLKEAADAVSYPNSVKYGHFMSYDEVYHSILGNTTANGHILEEWAITNGLKVTRTTKNKQFIMVEASPDTIEQVFRTKLQQYKHIKTGTTVLRSTSFELPLDIHNRVALIGGLSHFPVIHERKTKISDTAEVLTNAPIIYITPPVLRSLYNVKDSTTNIRDKRSRQAIAGFQEYLNIESFNNFAKLFGTKFPLLFGKVYGGNYNNSINNEIETSLDLQYMASMGSRIRTDYISSPDQYDGFLIDFFVQLALLEENKTNVVPLVYSISYGLDEDQSDASYINSCEVQFLIMSVTGKTVFVASGDNGIAGFNGICQNTFIPGYPSSSAYVTSVGATQFVQTTANCSRRLNGYCLEEVAAVTSSLTGCGITSGGGFSKFIDMPEYQQHAVNTYLNNTKNQLPPDTYFSRSNRAFPDISLVGHQYQIKAYGNSDVFIDGTSASSPTLAGLVSLIVDRRLKLGMQPLGLLNPLLYTLSTTNSTVFYDITKGNNSCNESPVCCQYGFAASKYWDPVTGLGSINHEMLMELLITN